MSVETGSVSALPSVGSVAAAVSSTAGSVSATVSPAVSAVVSAVVTAGASVTVEAVSSSSSPPHAATREAMTANPTR